MCDLRAWRTEGYFCNLASDLLWSSHAKKQRRNERHLLCEKPIDFWYRRIFWVLLALASNDLSIQKTWSLNQAWKQTCQNLPDSNRIDGNVLMRSEWLEDCVLSGCFNGAKNRARIPMIVVGRVRKLESGFRFKHRVVRNLRKRFIHIRAAWRRALNHVYEFARRQ